MLVAGVLAQQTAQPPHVVLEHLGGAGRWVLAPQALDQMVGLDRAVGLEAQHRQHGTLLGPAERERPAVGAGVNRAKNAELHGSAHPTATARL
jgi:hypothetical protein